MTDSEFVKLWNKAQSVAVVAKELGIKPVSASVRASKLRALGKRLKKFTAGRKAA